MEHKDQLPEELLKVQLEVHQENMEENLKKLSVLVVLVLSPISMMKTKLVSP